MSKYFAELSGPVTTKEAYEIASRFNASHFRNPEREHARVSIPANPMRDDDIRLGAFIEHTEALVVAAECALVVGLETATVEALRIAIANLKQPAGSPP